MPDDSPKAFFAKIVNTISIILVGMIAIIFFGIYKKYAFFEDKPTAANYLFYATSLAGLAGIIIYLRKKWKI